MFDVRNLTFSRSFLKYKSRKSAFDAKILSQQQIQDLIAAGETIVCCGLLIKLTNCFIPNVTFFHVLFNGHVCKIPPTFAHPGGRDLIKTYVAQQPVACAGSGDGDSTIVPMIVAGQAL